MENKILTLACVLFAIGLPLLAQTAPPQAVAQNYTTLVFSDDFTSASTFSTNTGSALIPGVNWYYYPYGKNSTNGGIVTINTGAGSGVTAGATGIVNINNCVIQTVPTHATVAMAIANPPIVGTYKHFYFEARVQFNGTVTGSGGPGLNQGWPSVWSYDISGYDQNIATQSSELDFFEAYPNGTAGASIYSINTIHNWQHTSAGSSGHDTFNTSTNAHMMNLGSPAGPAPTTGDGRWHIFGGLWNQVDATHGWVEFYFDNQLIYHQGAVARFPTGAGTGLTQMEIANLFLLLGGGNGWSENVDWVHVFALTPATAQTLSPFPPTLALNTTDSPYNLPPNTSAGLAVTYTVTSGAATVSNHTLTFSTPGTVVVHAAQAGNATYLPFSANETITVKAPQAITGFTTTANVLTTDSPYSLPAATTAGLTPTYTVTSGAGTISGNALTFAVPTTLVIHAAQAGNALYLPYSADKTVNVTLAPPAAPTGLGVTGGNAKATVAWTASPTATAYKIYRSTVNGSGYTLIASVITAAPYVDLGLTNETTYYYVVQASNAGGTSPNSSQASVTPHGTTTTISFPGSTVAPITLQGSLNVNVSVQSNP